MRGDHGDAAETRRDVYDFGGAGFLQQGHERGRQCAGAEDVGVEHRTERVAGRPLGVAAFGTDAGVVDEDVEMAELGLDLLGCGDDAGVVGVVELDEAKGAFDVGPGLDVF